MRRLAAQRRIFFSSGLVPMLRVCRREVHCAWAQIVEAGLGSFLVTPVDVNTEMARGRPDDGVHFVRLPPRHIS